MPIEDVFSISGRGTVVSVMLARPLPTALNCSNLMYILSADNLTWCWINGTWIETQHIFQTLLRHNRLPCVLSPGCSRDDKSASKQRR